MPLPDEWYQNHLHLKDQKESAEEFLVDALYLTKVGTLLCKVANRTCFKTRKAEDMKKHRETWKVLNKAVSSRESVMMTWIQMNHPPQLSFSPTQHQLPTRM